MYGASWFGGSWFGGFGAAPPIAEPERVSAPAPRGNGLATLLLIWYGGVGGVVGDKPRSTRSRLAYDGRDRTTTLPRQRSVPPPTEARSNTAQRLGPRLAALFAFTLDDD